MQNYHCTIFTSKGMRNVDHVRVQSVDPVCAWRSARLGAAFEHGGAATDYRVRVQDENRTQTLIDVNKE